jgi:hypothetical protein
MKRLRPFGSVASLSVVTQIRDIRVVKTPFTTRYEIPTAGQGSLVAIKQNADSMIVIMNNNAFPVVKEISPLYINGCSCNKQQAKMVGGTQERREDY